jgi:hypothetical protein
MAAASTPLTKPWTFGVRPARRQNGRDHQNEEASSEGNRAPALDARGVDQGRAGSTAPLRVG